jgi:hypothetical protein
MRHWRRCLKASAPIATGGSDARLVRSPPRRQPYRRSRLFAPDRRGAQCIETASKHSCRRPCAGGNPAAGLRAFLNQGCCKDDGTIVTMKCSTVGFEKALFRSRETRMIYRVTAAIFAGLVVVGAAAAQSTTPSSEKPETSCTTSSAATTGSAGEKTSNSMAMEKSAILPDAGGANSAAPTVQSGGKPMQVRSECPPDSKPK